MPKSDVALPKSLKIKVCGMRDAENVQQVLQLQPDFLGFIFYEHSARYTPTIPTNIAFGNTKKVGVFVNETLETIQATIEQFQLDAVQLHGNEPVSVCQALRQQVMVIKAFGIERKEDVFAVEHYLEVVDYALLDTKTKQHGGSGRKFNWDILQHYPYELPFFLSGGIGVEDGLVIKQNRHKACVGVDVNSKFELEPAKKDVSQLARLFKQLKQNQ